MSGLLLLAFGAGLLAPVTPCGFAVLPVILAYGTKSSSAKSQGWWALLARGLRSGLALTLGFTGTFTVVGLLIAAGLRPLIGAIPWVAAVLGAVFVIVGVALFAGVKVPLGLTRLSSIRKGDGPGGMVALGVGYALASASCSLALLLAVVSQALSGTGWGSVLLVFAAYAVGSSVLLLTLSVGTAFAGNALTRYVRRLVPHMSRITGTILALSGAYLVLYWIPQLFGGAPGITVLSGPASALSDWIGSNQIAIVSIAVVMVLAIVIASVVKKVASRRKRVSK